MASPEENQSIVDKFFKYSVWSFYSLIAAFLILFVTIFKAPAIGFTFLVIALFGYAAPRIWVLKYKNDPVVATMIEDRKIKNKALLKKLSQIVVVDHLAGFEEFEISRSCSLYPDEDGLHLNYGNKQVKIFEWKNIIEVNAGSEDELRKRVTLSRVLLTGIFALALKKEKKKKFYLTITTNNAVGLFEINTIGRDNRRSEQKAQVFSAFCNSKVRSADPVDARDSTQNEDIFEQIEKLGKLLEKGLITEADFEKSKSSLLERL